MAVIGAIALIVGLTTPAPAAPVVFTRTPIAGWSTNGQVRAVLIVGDTVYAGGSFTQVRGPGGTPTLARTNLAAFDVHTGAIRTGFSADTNGRIQTFATDGAHLFVGGDFTTIKGSSKVRIASLDLTTGNVNTAFTANATNWVYTLHVTGNRLYAGGTFSLLNGLARTRIGAVSTTTGAVDPTFDPNANDAVHAIVVSPDGNTVYVGGDFTTIGGGNRAWLAPVSATTGALLPLTFQYPVITGSAPGVDSLELSPGGDRLFGGLVGYENRVTSWSTSTGQQQWFYQVDGDVQAVRYYNGNVFFGFHEGALADDTVRMRVVDSATGTLVPFPVPMDSFFGVWDIAVSPAALVVGGEFANVNGVRTQGLAILPPGSSDPVAPTAPANLRVTGGAATTISLAWNPGTDDVGVAGYRVLRDGVEVGYPTGAAFTDSDLRESTSYTYTVQTEDTAGNFSSPSTAVTGTTGAILTPAGAVWKYLDTGSNQGVAWRAPAFNDSAWASGAAELGYGDSDETTVVGSGPDPNRRYITTYFRRQLTVANPASISALTLRLLRDDGAVVYLNGTEVVRSNMPAGTISSTTTASTNVDGTGESQWFSSSVNPSLLVAGTNTLAVEIHQQWSGSSDISFNLALEASPRQGPPPPTNLHTTGVTDSSVSLAWDAPAGTIAGYRVSRGGVLVGSPTATSFTDTGLPGGQPATYTVTAVDGLGVESTPSAAVTATTLDLVAPTTPTGLTAPTIAGDRVVLAWTPSTDNVGVTGYDVLRNASVIGTTATTTFTDTGVTPGQTSSYAIRARDAAGNISAVSNPLPVSTPAFVGVSYEDSFDSGGFTGGRWTASNATIVTGTAPNPFFARLTSTGGNAGYLNLPASVISQNHRSWSFRGYFRIESRTAGQDVSLVAVRDVAGPTHAYLWADRSTGRCTVGLATANLTSSTTSCTDDAWHLVEMQGDFGSSTYTLGWKLDGVVQTSISSTAQTPSTVKSLWLGEPVGGPTNVSAWDNVRLVVGDSALPFLGGATPFG